MSEGESADSKRGPKQYECDVCRESTYETGPCDNCGAGPFEDEARDVEWYCAGCGSTFTKKPNISCPNCPYVGIIKRSLSTESDNE